LGVVVGGVRRLPHRAPVHAIKEKKQVEQEFNEELVASRLAVSVGDIYFTTEPHFKLTIVRKLLDAIASLITKEDSGAWSALLKLSSLKWSGEVDTKILLSLKKLCIALEKSPSPIPGSPASTLVARIAGLPGTDRYLLWLLRILQRMEDRHGSSDRLWQDVRKSAITRIIRTANDDDSMAGLARWFTRLDTSMQSRTSHAMVEMPKVLRIDKQQMMRLAEQGQGDLRSGAVLILANSRTLTYEQAKLLLSLQSDEWEMYNCWAELIEGTVQSSDDSEAIGFLEEIVSSASIYPKAARYAALAKYEQVARSSTIDILRQETRLGLPFQDVLRLKRKQEEVSTR
jgi:hypothetical protein